MCYENNILKIHPLGWQHFFKIKLFWWEKPDMKNYFLQGSSEVASNRATSSNKISTISGHLVADPLAKAQSPNQFEVDLNQSRDNLDSQSTKTEDTVDYEKVLYRT